MAAQRGVLLAFDGTTAIVELDAAPGRPVAGVRVTRLPAGEFVPGRRVLVDLDEAGGPDAVIVAVWA
jgi:hypothetical protein